MGKFAIAMKKAAKIFQHFKLIIIVIGAILWITYSSLSGSDALDKFIPLLLCVSSLLVIIDTGIFIKSGNTISSSHGITDSEKKSKFDLFRNIASLLNIFSILGGCLIVFLSICLWLKIISHEWINNNYLIMSEGVFCLIFFIFFIADSFEKKALNLSEAEELQSHKSILEYSIPLIDAVGMLGIFVIFVLSFYDHYIVNDFNVFFDGFSIGALVFHVILTQFNLAYLNYKYE